MKTKTTIATIMTLASTHAYADFYDGAPLPPEKNWQEQMNVDVGESISITAITKYIPSNGNTVSVIAVGETDGVVNPPGFAQGYRFDLPFGKLQVVDGEDERQRPHYLGILPIVQGAVSTENVTVAPTLYTTVTVGPLTFDPSVQLPMSLTYQGDFSFDAVVTGATVGIAVNDNLRVGPDVQANVLDKESLTLGTMLRYDPVGANGNHWMQLGLNTTLEGTATAQAQYRINF
jgi:hypothetical protein